MKESEVVAFVREYVINHRHDTLLYRKKSVTNCYHRLTSCNLKIARDWTHLHPELWDDSFKVNV